MKRCSKCGIEKDESEFNKQKSAKDGLQSYCRACSNTYRLKPENRRIYNAKMLSDRRLNAARINFNPYANKTLKKCYNCKQLLQRKYFSRNMSRSDGLMAACKVCEGIRRDKRRSCEGTYEWSDVFKQYINQQGRCYYCEVDLIDFWCRGQTWELDHKHPLARQGTNWPSNLVCACLNCNHSKNDRLYPEEWMPNGEKYEGYIEVP